FQAEDGIRDFHVTGVQTCALPIFATEEKLKSFFKEFFPDTLELMPTLVENYFTNPTSSLVTTQCYPWVYKDKVALLGDAAHAIEIGRASCREREDIWVRAGRMIEK